MPPSPNVTWQDSGLSRPDRWRALDTRGATVWLTGLPASGKSTLGGALEKRLVTSGRFAYLLDGDNLRHGICGDLGFSRTDRALNILRVGELARLFADAGAVAIVALVSPLAAVRDHVRAEHEAARLRFIEVFVDTPLAECVARDPKNLYSRARAGELRGFTGVDDAYEPPGQPELTLGPGTGVASAVDAMLGLLERAGAAEAEERARRRVFSRGAEVGASHQPNGVSR
jgi:adenylyl-sulfate kinase